MRKSMPTGDSTDSCRVCGHPLEGRDRCEMCGSLALPLSSPPAVLKCPLCGGEVDGSLSCTKCGRIFGREVEAAEPKFQCPRCGNDVAVDDTDCASCGLRIWIDEATERAVLDSLRCPACGAALGLEDKKCERCGFLAWFETEEEGREKAVKAIDDAVARITEFKEKMGQPPERAVTYLEGAKRVLEAGEVDMAWRRAKMASDIAETTARQAEILREATRRAEARTRSAEEGGADVAECRELLTMSEEANRKGELKLALRLALRCKIMAENIEDSRRRAPLGA